MANSVFQMNVVKLQHSIQGAFRMPEWKAVSIQEAAQHTGYHPEYLRDLCRRGEIEFMKIGRVYLLKWESVKAYIDKMKNSDDWRAGPRRNK